MRSMSVVTLAPVVLVSLLAGASGCAPAGGGKAAAPAPEGKDAGKVVADFALKDVQGRTVRLSDSAGQVRLVDFWATWCAPCREEIPMFKDLHATYGPRGLTLLAISDEDADTVRAFVEKEGIPWTNLLDEGQTAEQFGGVVGLPTAFLLDGEGRIVDRFGPGLVPRSVLEPKIKALLQREAAGA
jgi:peroxiredoxin